MTAPVRESNRITIIDSIRGVALLGILLMNIPYFANPHQFDFDLRLRNEFSGINYYTWWAVNGFFEGTMRGLFTILFGAGCILLLSRLEKKGPTISAADIYYRRLLWLLMFGLINAYVFLWPGDILYSYAICGLFLFPFRNMKAKHLLVIAIALFTITTAKDTWKAYSQKQMRVQGENALVLEKTNQKLTPAQEEAKGTWIGFQEKTKVENIRKEAEGDVVKMQQNYFGVWAHLKNIIVWLETTKFYSNFFLDIMLLLFLGMALFKMGVLTGQQSKGLYWVLLIAGYGIGLSLSYWRMNASLITNFDSTRYLDVVKIDVYQAKRMALTLGHISFFMLLYKYNIAKNLMRWLSRVGQMAFTNYLMQSLICTLLF